jgi:hypothetical protein
MDQLELPACVAYTTAREMTRTETKLSELFDWATRPDETPEYWRRRLGPTLPDDTFTYLAKMVAAERAAKRVEKASN